MIRVLLVDDQRLVRAGFRSILDGEADIDVVGESGSARLALGRISATLPDVVVLDVRLLLRTDDGEHIYMSYRGLRHGPAEVMARLAAGEPVDPATYYFRIAPVFETAAKKYDWINKIVAVGTGRREATGPIYSVHEVL